MGAIVKAELVVGNSPNITPEPRNSTPITEECQTDAFDDASCNPDNTTGVSSRTTPPAYEAGAAFSLRFDGVYSFPVSDRLHINFGGGWHPQLNPSIYESEVDGVTSEFERWDVLKFGGYVGAQYDLSPFSVGLNLYADGVVPFLKGDMWTASGTKERIDQPLVGVQGGACLTGARNFGNLVLGLKGCITGTIMSTFEVTSAEPSYDVKLKHGPSGFGGIVVKFGNVGSGGASKSGETSKPGEELVPDTPPPPPPAIDDDSL